MSARAARRIPGLRLGAVAAIVVFLVLAGTGVSFAFWTAASQTATGTEASAAVSTTMTGVGGLNTTWNFNGAATNSPYVVTPITVTNTGGAPLNYQLAITSTNPTLAGLTKLWLWKATGTPATTCAATPPPATAQGTLAAPPSLPTGTTSLAASGSYVLCAATQLNSTIAASGGTAVTATATITGTVGSNWSTSAQGATTETVAAIGVLDATCTTNGQFFNSITLSWTAVTAATAGGTVTYYLTGNGSTANLGTTTGTSANISWNGSGNASTVSVQAKTATGAVSNIESFPVSYQIFNLGISC